MSDHTQGEMTIGKEGFGGGISEADDYCNLHVDGRLIGTVMADEVGIKKARANAERMIRSWNQYDAFAVMLAALENVLDECDDVDRERRFDGDDHRGLTQPIRGIVSVAIARAKPQPKTAKR